MHFLFDFLFAEVIVCFLLLLHILEEKPSVIMHEEPQWGEVQINQVSSVFHKRAADAFLPETQATLVYRQAHQVHLPRTPHSSHPSS